MSNVLKEVDRTETKISVDAPITTNEIVTNFEKRLERSIANKVLNSSKNGEMPVFTPEETAYLNKQSATPNTEVEVITADPPITLKSGGTRIDIKNAASLVKRMDAAHPRTSPSPALKPSEINDFEKIESDANDGLSSATLKQIDESVNKVLPKLNVSAKSGNKNAYEIRESILELSIRWATKDVETSSKYSNPDDIIKLAKKFYSFVENKS